MASVRLDFFSIRLKEYGKDGDYVSINTWLRDSDFTEFFKGFIESLDIGGEVDNIEKKMFEFENEDIHFHSDKKLITGIISSGEFGRVRKLKDVISKEPKGNLGKTTSIMSPFYFLLYFPNDSITGFLIIQRYGQQGISTVFRKYFKNYFRSLTKEYIIDLSPMISKEVLLAIIKNSEIKEVKLRRYDVTQETSQLYNLGSLKPQEPLILELRILHSAGFGISTKSKVLNYIQNPNGAFFDLPQLNSIGFDKDTEISITVDDNGTQRTIILDNPDKFRSSFDITNEVVFDSDGNPRFSSINEIAKEYLKRHFYNKSDA